MAETVIVSAATIQETAISKFSEQFGGRPTSAGIAPGRVNIIGEHTDYNDGFVFPMALPLYTVVVGSLNQESKCRVLTTTDDVDEPKLVEFDVPTADKPLTPSKEAPWSNYFKGVVANFHGKVKGFNAVVATSVPLGGGLSSSASLEVAAYTFLETLLDSPAQSPSAKALACQQAEHQFANMPCGIMDQFVCTMATEGHALLIDCRSLEWEQVPLKDPSLSVVVCNSNVRHTLSGSEYPARRADCFAAAKAMGKQSLRDATIDDIKAHESVMSVEVGQRARHVVGEIGRTQQAVAALKNADYEQFGALMTLSHNSLRDDYAVSCGELDELVAAALQVPGVLGSRMTGGGFGGCTVTLVKRESVPRLLAHIAQQYSGTPTFYVATPSKGAYGVSL